jgi:hypothetical protein
MASATAPRIQGTAPRKAGVRKPAAQITQSGDSRENLLKDVMHEIGIGLEGMNPSERNSAIAEIHSIAENVRKRQA